MASCPCSTTEEISNNRFLSVKNSRDLLQGSLSHYQFYEFKKCISRCVAYVVWFGDISGKGVLEMVQILHYNDSDYMLKCAAEGYIIKTFYRGMQVVIVGMVKDRLGPMIRSKQKTLKMSQKELPIRWNKFTEAVGTLKQGETTPGFKTMPSIVGTFNPNSRPLICCDALYDGVTLGIATTFRQIKPEKRQQLGIARLMAQQGD